MTQALATRGRRSIDDPTRGARLALVILAPIVLLNLGIVLAALLWGGAGLPLDAFAPQALAGVAAFLGLADLSCGLLFVVSLWRGA